MTLSLQLLSENIALRNMKQDPAIYIYVCVPPAIYTVYLYIYMCVPPANFGFFMLFQFCLTLLYCITEYTVLLNLIRAITSHKSHHISGEPPHLIKATRDVNDNTSSSIIKLRYQIVSIAKRNENV